MVGRLNKSGFRDWLVQRVTAIILGAYAVFLISYFVTYQPVYFAQWHTLFSHLWMKIFTFTVLGAVLWHAWIGLWTVFTDYIKSRGIRLLLEALVCFLLVVYFVWGLEILFSVLK